MVDVSFPLFAPRARSTKSRGRVGGARVTFLLPDDVSPADIRFLRSVWTRLGGDPDADINWTQRWEDVVGAPSPTRVVVSFGKTGLEAWHRWGVVRVGDHGTMFHRPNASDGHWVMVCEHPAAIMQQTAWGYGVKEHLMDELDLVFRVCEGMFAPGDLLGGRCLLCWHKRDGKRVLVQHYHWEVDAVALCEDHWRKRANIKIKGAVKKRVHPSSREAQIEEQVELV